MGMEKVELKNGSFEVDSLVISSVAALEILQRVSLHAFCDLVDKCRDENHRLITAKVLMNANMIDSDRGTIHGYIKNVVLSAVEGEGFTMKLVSPLAEKGE